MTYLQFLKRIGKDIHGFFYVVYGGNSRVRQDVVDILAFQQGVKNRAVLSSDFAGDYVRWLYGAPSSFCVLHWKKGTDKTGLVDLMLATKRRKTADNRVCLGFVVILDDEEEVCHHLKEYKTQVSFVDCGKRPGDMSSVVKMRSGLDTIICDKQSTEVLSRYSFPYFLSVYGVLRRLNKTGIRYKEVGNFLIPESGRDVHVGELLLEKGKQHIFKMGLWPEDASKFFKGLYTMLTKMILVKSVTHGRLGDRTTRLGMSFMTVKYYMELTRGMHIVDIYKRLNLVLIYMSKRGLMLNDRSLMAQFLFRW